MPFDVASGTWNSWNCGKLIGQKAPLKPQDVWPTRVRLEIAEKRRDLAHFNLAIDSKLRGCDLVPLRASSYSAIWKGADETRSANKLHHGVGRDPLLARERVSALALFSRCRQTG